MAEKPDYCKATNFAYDVLLRNYDGRMPKINMFDILSKYKNIVTHTYSEASRKFGYDHSYFYRNIATSEHGFTISKKSKNQHLILYNEQKPEQTIRFTLAHELGHILLGHTKDDEKEKKEANCFARNLLCPLPIVDGFHLNTAKDYEDCFEISEPMAEAALSFKNADHYNVSKDNYDRLDTKVYCYFSGYNTYELYA